MLNSLKREVGLPVEFSNDKKELQGDGNLAAKVLTANSWVNKQFLIIYLRNNLENNIFALS